MGFFTPIHFFIPHLQLHTPLLFLLKQLILVLNWVNFPNSPLNGHSDFDLLTQVVHLIIEHRFVTILQQFDFIEIIRRPFGWRPFTISYRYRQFRVGINCDFTF